MQLQEDDSRRVDSPLLNTTGLKSLSYLCMEATGRMLDNDHNDDYSSEHDATTNHTTMFGNCSSVGEQVVKFVQLTSGEVVQANVLQTLTSSLCSVVNGSLNQACVNGDFDLNMIQIQMVCVRWL